VSRLEDEFRAFVDEARKAERQLDALTRSPSVRRAEREIAEIGSPRLYVAALLHRILTEDLSVTALRALVRQLVPWIERGLRQHQVQTQLQPARRQGQQVVAEQKRFAIRQVLGELARIKRRGRATTDAAAAVVYLAKADPEWHVGTDAERQKKVENLLRRVRAFRKKSPDSR
jgi:hypothetical protein